MVRIKSCKSASDLGINTGEVVSHVRQVGLTVREVHGECEFIPGESISEKAATLAQRLRQDALI